MWEFSAHGSLDTVPRDGGQGDVPMNASSTGSHSAKMVGSFYWSGNQGTGK